MIYVLTCWLRNIDKNTTARAFCPHQQITTDADKNYVAAIKATFTYFSSNVSYGYLQIA